MTRRPGLVARLGSLGLRRKIMAGALLLVMVFGSAVMGSIHHGLAELLRDELSRRGRTTAELLGRAAEQFVLTDNVYALHDLISEAVRTREDVRYVFVADAGGGVIAHTFPQGMPAGLPQAHPAGPRDVQLLRTEEGFLQDVSRPLLDGRLGAIHVGIKEQSVRRRVARMAFGWGVLAAVALILGLIAAHWLTSRLCGRIQNLIEAARSVGSGNLEARARGGSGDEVGQLAAEFNKMAENLKSSQDQLIRAGRLAAIGELASCVSHEVNNPLNHMSFCAQALWERSAAPALRAQPGFEDFPEYLTAIRNEIFRCKKITSGLLDFARQREPRWASVHINAVVADTVPLIEQRCQKAGIHVRLELSEGLPPLQADGDQLRQVLLNLCLNAVDQMPAGGHLTVRTCAVDAGVRLSVGDTGPGVRVADLAKLFTPFFSTKTQGEGTGLGLAICQRIVEGHGGRIAAISPSGGGANFEVYLPAKPAQRPAAAWESPGGMS
ncbi:MAG TPA: hypothetical protein DD417_07600 [Elusimicrobia bacterium]|nr:hypothetical protein [Elusimicrobiota bacterium]